MRFRLEKVHYMPKQLDPGVLYYSKEFNTCAHLCACGCGSKIRTPIGPTEWRLMQTKRGPTLHPSIGNWQIECQSHYWIRNGEVQWASKWTEDEILEGRHAEQVVREIYYEKVGRSEENLLEKLWRWFLSHLR